MMTEYFRTIIGIKQVDKRSYVWKELFIIRYEDVYPYIRPPFFVTLRPTHLDSKMGWTGGFWSKTNIPK